MYAISSKSAVAACALILWGAGLGAAAAQPRALLRDGQVSSWTLRDGAPPEISAIVQSPDGFIWLATGVGLFRFDGISFSRPMLNDPQDCAGARLTSLEVTPSGDLWAGLRNGGVAHVTGSTLACVQQNTEGQPFGSVYDLKQGADGDVWAATNLGLEHLHAGRWRFEGSPAGVADTDILRVLPASDGAVWAASRVHLFMRAPGAARFHAWRRAPNGAPHLAEAPDHRVWIGDDSGVAPVSAPNIARKPRGNGAGALMAMTFLRDGSLWIAGKDGEERRWPASQVAAGRPVDRSADWSSPNDGLASKVTRAIFEDREGGVWLAGDAGISRFGATDVHTLTGGPSDAKEAVLATTDSDGVLYAAELFSGAVWRVGADRKPRLLFNAPGGEVTAIGAMPGGPLWLVTRSKFLLYQGGRLSSLSSPVPAGVSLFNLAISREGVVFAPARNGVVYRWRRGVWDQLPFERKDLLGGVYRLATGDEGRLWLNLSHARLGYFDGAEAHIIELPEVRRLGSIRCVFPDREGLLLAGDKGLGRLQSDRLQFIDGRLHPELSHVSGIVRRGSGELWLHGVFGLVRTSEGALDHLFMHPDQPLPGRLFDARDGLSGPAVQEPWTGSAWAGPGDRVWLYASHAFAWIDTAHLLRHRLPPPVSILSPQADGSGVVREPAGTSDLRIDYAGLSYDAPSRVRFRYRLEGLSDRWVDAGARRSAFFTNLAAGRYHFSVLAQNGDGVWSPQGASLDLLIPPTFVQSWAFRAMVVLVTSALLALGIWFWLRTLIKRMREGLEERTRERERIAGDLHDTLLQGVQGLLLRFQSIAEQIPPTDPVRTDMDAALDRTEQVLAEGRDRVHGLRTAPRAEELAEALYAVAPELRAVDSDLLKVHVLGRMRDLHPVVAGEAVQIGREAVANALLHARAQEIQATLHFHPWRFSLTVEDDGIGIPEEVLRDGGRSGHYGLAGMKERAARIRAALVIESSRTGGVRVRLQVPGRLAYHRVPLAGMLSHLPPPPDVILRVSGGRRRSAARR